MAAAAFCEERTARFLLYSVINEASRRLRDLAIIAGLHEYWIDENQNRGLGNRLDLLSERCGFRSLRGRVFQHLRRRFASRREGTSRNFAVELKHDAAMLAYVGIFAGVKEKSSETKSCIDRIRTFLIRDLKIDPTRIVIKNLGKKKDQLTILQPCPKDREPPFSKSIRRQTAAGV